MLAGHLWKQWTESGDLEELRRNTMVEIAAVIFVIAWVLMIGGYGEPVAFIVPAVLMVGSAVSIWRRETNFRWALVWLFASLIVALAAQKWFFPTMPAQYGFPIVVVVASLLISGPKMLIVAFFASIAILGVALGQGADWLDQQEIVVPILITWLTVCAAWIGSRQMHLALNWMSTGYRRANELLQELRDERASLARTLKVLEEAYVRIEKMNYALIEARSAAENARQLKAEFAANISHELRTPLNLIIGFSETMANAPETYQGVAWSPALRGDVEQIYQSSRHLASLIDDILDLSALDARRLGLTLQDAAMPDVIAEAVALMQDLFRAKSLYLNTEIEPNLPRVRIDVTRIRQVLINLLTNASRFTERGGVTIRAYLVAERGEIEIAVQDTGVGIAAHDIPIVFEEFGQVDGSTTRRHEGTGLGVPLSKRLVESHGGRMWLESRPGLGTTFYFTLPAAESSHLGQVYRTRSMTPPARKAILAFEPDPLLLRTLRRQLGSYDVIQVDGSDASLAALIEQHQPLAFIVNASAPAFRVPDDLPVIRVSMAGSLHAAQALGVENYLIKPILREELLGAIEGLGRPVRDVLIVDDDPEMVELIARMLQSAGDRYRPIKAFGGADGLARLRGEKVDLVLLDLTMPEIDGMAMIKTMKSDAELAALPVIVITAQHPELTAEQGGLCVQLERVTCASTAETLNYLQVLVAALPLRGLPPTTDAPT